MQVHLYCSWLTHAISLAERQPAAVVSSVNYKLWKILLGDNKGVIEVELQNLLRDNANVNDTTMLDLNAQTRHFVCTPLIYAILKSYTKIALILIDNGADVNVSDSAGMTPIMHAVRYELEDCIKLLISRGADPDLENVLQGIEDTNSYIELSCKSRAKIQTAFDVGKAMWNDRIKKLQFEITKQSKIYPVLAVIISEYCQLR